MQVFQFDLSVKNVTQILNVKQGDVGRRFKAVITDGGAAYNIPNGARFSLWYSGPGGEGNYSAIEQKSAFTVEGNAVTVELIAQMLTNPGVGALCVVMNGADGIQLGLWNMAYAVESVPGMGSEAAQQYYTALSEVAAQAIRAAETFRTDTTMTAAGTAADAAAVGYALAGKAPAGYGLGVSVSPYTKLTELSQLDGFVRNGWYAVQVSGFQISVSPITYWMLRVTAYNDSCLMQELIPVDGSVIVRRFNHHGTWTAFEWENPNMVVGVEYVTAKKYNGKTVYAKLLDIGILPNNSNKTVSVGAAMKDIVSLELYASTGQATVKFPWNGVDGTVKGTVYASTTTVVVFTFTDASAYSGKVVIEYTKD